MNISAWLQSPRLLLIPIALVILLFWGPQSLIDLLDWRNQQHVRTQASTRGLQAERERLDRLQQRQQHLQMQSGNAQPALDTDRQRQIQMRLQQLPQQRSPRQPLSDFLRTWSDPPERRLRHLEILQQEHRTELLRIELAGTPAAIDDLLQQWQQIATSLDWHQLILEPAPADQIRLLGRLESRWHPQGIALQASNAPAREIPQQPPADTAPALAAAPPVPLPAQPRGTLLQDGHCQAILDHRGQLLRPGDPLGEHWRIRDCGERSILIVNNRAEHHQLPLAPAASAQQLQRLQPQGRAHE